jgi:hypothetical protein
MCGVGTIGVPSVPEGIEREFGRQDLQRDVSTHRDSSDCDSSLIVRSPREANRRAFFNARHDLPRRAGAARSIGAPIPA